MHLVPLTLLLLRLLLESYALSNSDMANIQEVLEICLACKKQVLSPIFFFSGRYLSSSKHRRAILSEGSDRQQIHSSNRAGVRTEV